MLLEAIVPLHLCQHCFIDACAQFSQNAAHTSRTLSLQDVLLWQSVLCQPDTESLVIAEVYAGPTMCLEQTSPCQNRSSMQI